MLPFSEIEPCDATEIITISQSLALSLIGLLAHRPVGKCISLNVLTKRQLCLALGFRPQPLKVLTTGSTAKLDLREGRGGGENDGHENDGHENAGHVSGV